MEEKNMIAELTALEPVGMDEQLFTVEDKYLYIQRTDTGVDYTIYDNSLAEIDGGQFDVKMATLAEAAIEVCKFHGIRQDSPIQFTDIGILKRIQAVQDAKIPIELSDDQLKRNDDIYYAAFVFCKMLTENENLEWDMSILGELAEDAAEMLVRHGHKVRFPAFVKDKDGNEEIDEYYLI